MPKRSETRTTIPHGTGTRFDLEPGDELLVVTPDGGQGGDLSFVGFDQSVTRNAIGWERFGKPWLVFSAEPGDRLYDGDGQPVMKLLSYDADGAADIMYPGCWSGVYEDGRAGCRDLISAALGLERHQLTGMLSFFISHTADDSAYRGLGPVGLKPGDSLRLRALTRVACAVSTCPDTEIEGWSRGDLEVTVTPARR